MKENQPNNKKSANVIQLDLKRQQKEELKEKKAMDKILKKFLKHEKTLDW